MLQTSTYITRFAPTPSGRLHIGSIIAAVASFLECRANNGVWYLRLDDLDSCRVSDHYACDIVKNLQELGFSIDGIVKQNSHKEHYQKAIDSLMEYSFFCVCSRKTVADCKCFLKKYKEGSLRILTPEIDFLIIDGLQGEHKQNLFRFCDNMVLKRADGVVSYHLATVVDDALMGVNHIVRGFDLLASTPRQVYLQRLLGFNDIHYAHIPIALNSHGQKHSKQTHAPAVMDMPGSLVLWHALSFLAMNPPKELQHASLAKLWQWAEANWSIMLLRGKQAIEYQPFL